jgi:hypothetical protein
VIEDISHVGGRRHCERSGRNVGEGGGESRTDSTQQRWLSLRYAAASGTRLADQQSKLSLDASIPPIEQNFPPCSLRASFLLQGRLAAVERWMSHNCPAARLQRRMQARLRELTADGQVGSSSNLLHEGGLAGVSEVKLALVPCSA